MTDLDTAIGAAWLRILTNREYQVAELVSRGLANKVIAHHLSVTEGTVKIHAHAIFQKLGVRNRGELIRTFATRDGSTTSL
jgi:DNA-binding NarL/FixJ family response regulator